MYFIYPDGMMPMGSHDSWMSTVLGGGPKDPLESTSAGTVSGDPMSLMSKIWSQSADNGWTHWANNGDGSFSSDGGCEGCPSHWALIPEYAQDPSNYQEGPENKHDIALEGVTVSASREIQSSEGDPEYFPVQRAGIGGEDIIGPGLIAVGARIKALKPVGALGSQPGSSIASSMLSKVLPVKMPFRVAGTTNLGRMLGRTIPFTAVGVVMTASSIEDLIREASPTFDRIINFRNFKMGIKE